MNKNNAYFGKNSLKEYLNPSNHVTPLVELPFNLNPLRKKGVRIFAKMMHMNPLLNIKLLAAYNMMISAEKKGLLKNKKSIVENSSGNTAYSLSVIARIMGINNVSAYVSHEVIAEKLNLLRLFGIKPIVNIEDLCPDPNDPESGINKARKKGRGKNCFNPCQYDNLGNPKAHMKWTGPQIWNQTKGRISVFCSGLGTTGTLTGTSKYLKKKNKKIKIIGVVRLPNNPLPGVRTHGLLKMIDFKYKECIDEIIEESTVNSYSKSLQLLRNGLMAGPSSGFSLSGLIKYLESADLESLKNKDDEVVCVFMCFDTPLPYINEYFKYLDSSLFPEIMNKEFLREEIMNPKNDFEINPLNAFKKIYSGKKINKRVKIIDISPKDVFESHHLFGSEWRDYKEILLKDSFPEYEKSIVYVICSHGYKSIYAAGNLQNKGIKAYSIKGGMMEWSSLGLLREKSEKCKNRYKK